MHAGHRGFRAELRLADEAATRRLGNDLALALVPGDVVRLSGDLGVGKTALARAMIQTIAGEPIEVGSPSFALVHAYDLTRMPVMHADLYRMDDGRELDELGLEEAADGVLLIEWADRAPGFGGKDAIDVTIDLDREDPGARTVRIATWGIAAARLQRSLAVRGFLDASGRGGAHRQPLLGDASARSYERVGDGSTLILMNDPPRPPPPPMPDGRDYADVAKLSGTLTAFACVAGALVERGFHAPRVEAADFDLGLVLAEDLGGESIARDGVPDKARYLATARALAEMRRDEWPETLSAFGRIHEPPPYDREALMVEVSLFLDWRDDPTPVSDADREAFLTGWNTLIDRLETRPKTLVLRDVHSPNVLWLDGEEGLARVGLIDLQDAVIGDPAYDLASLAQDLRAEVGDDLEMEIAAEYIAARRSFEPDLDEASLREAYAILALQRATKVHGLFHRLARRDGKESYLAHIPRVHRNIARNLRHPTLEPMRDVYARLL